MNIEELNESCAKYDSLEKRGSFYDVALNLIDNGFEVEAYLLILSTWNVKEFKYAVKGFDLVGFREVMTECKELLGGVDDKEFRDADFGKISPIVEKVYDKLSSLKGIGYTGASKELHLMNTRLFVMWDKLIREEYGFKTGDSRDYVNFLKKMQDKFKGIDWSGEKTFAKVIDEYNYVNITLPVLEGRSKKVD